MLRAYMKSMYMHLMMYVMSCLREPVPCANIEGPALQGFIFTWLIGYSALLGPIGGILLADYHIVRRRSLDVDALFSKDPAMAYWFQVGLL